MVADLGARGLEAQAAWHQGVEDLRLQEPLKPDMLKPSTLVNSGLPPAVWACNSCSIEG